MWAEMLIQAISTVAMPLLALIATNVAQNGRPGAPPPDLSGGPIDSSRLLNLPKHELVALFRALPPPTAPAGPLEFRGALAPKGSVMAPVSSYITNRIFSPPGMQWAGKAFAAAAPGDERISGTNIFSSRGGGDGWATARPFSAAIAPSRLDGRPALVLVYVGAFWGAKAGMRDELRLAAPGVWIGLGSMSATGGAQNCAPFVLYDSAEPPPERRHWHWPEAPARRAG